MLAKGQKILVVEDDRKAVATIRLYLEHDGFEVAAAYDGRRGLELLQANRYDLLILDLMLPEVDGLELCRRVRDESSTPIIMLTARTTEEDKLRGLEMGADDYVSKPFSPRELTARVRAVLRRAAPARQADAAVLHFKDLAIDLQNRDVRRRGRPVPLTPTEFRLLEIFARSPKRTFTRQELVERALGWDYDGMERTIDAHIRNLRKKLDLDPSRSSHITTVFGVGYKLADTAES